MRLADQLADGFEASGMDSSLISDAVAAVACVPATVR
jgi:hypothetical protein